MMHGSLKLANGDIFSGDWHGEQQESVGELIHYTGMGNFLEFLTDPAIKGKIVLSTYPGIFNCSIDEEKFESDHIQAAGIITQQIIKADHLKKQSIGGLCLEQHIPVMSGMDTRAIMKRLQKGGEMPAYMAPKSDLKIVASNPIQKQTKKSKTFNSTGSKHVLILDFGLKQSLLSWLKSANIKATIVSPFISKEEVASMAPDGIIFSGGPGNPTSWKDQFPVFNKLAKAYPTIGFGLGHQILAAAFGAGIEKLKRGHRSFKQPIIHPETSQVFLSNQNHGYVVDEQSLKNTGFTVSYQSVHDGTVEGLEHGSYPITTYQFHPDGKNMKLESFMLNAYVHQLNQQKGEKIYA